MTKRYIKYTLSTLLALGLGSCASEDFWDTFDRTADGPINFTVGVEASPSPVQRAMTRSASGTYSMQGDTKVLLKVDGKWTKITENSGEISKTVTGTVGEGGGLSFDKDNTLYWDDYGAGDPANTENTNNGLTILGVAVDGKTIAPTFGESDTWESLSWTVATDGSNVLDKDILVSKESTYKFSEKSSAKQLTFTHPLSKITFNIKAGQGFNPSKFDPTVTLSSATELKDKATSVYAYTKGTIIISTGVATHDNTTASVVTSTGSVVPEGYTIVKEAIVYPGTPLGTTDDAVIAILEAEGNVYFITAKAIRTAIGTSVGHYNAQAGYNYIINITVNKTGIRTTATVEDWNKVESGVVFPVININAGFGTKGTGTAPSGFTSFALWRSEDIEKTYQHEATLTGSIGDTPWIFNSLLYWPNHNTHYHFRGVYPASIKDSGSNDVLTVTPNAPNSTDVQYVPVSNASYGADDFPTNLMIGMPEFATETKCKNHNLDMSTNGICATEGNINLNFRYVMSQVEVKLSSVNDNTAANYVDLTNAKVELVNVGNSGKILLKDRSAVITDDGLQTFELPYVSDKKYHGTIIPQSLKGDKDNNKVQFKITVYSDTEKTKVEDVYYADVAPIKVKKAGSTDEAAATNAWESGVHYVYNLKITKTQITATASLTDWTTKEATEDVWF